MNATISKRNIATNRHYVWITNTNKRQTDKRDYEHIGPPAATEWYSVAALENQGLIGLYVKASDVSRFMIALGSVADTLKRVKP